MAKVLIVEDDPLVLRMYQKVLKFEGMEVFTAENGIDGIEAVKKHKPDLVLLDIMMPKMNGIEVLDRLKADKETADIPVIMLTNLSGEHDTDNAIKRGAVAYLVKSQYRPKEVVEKVKEVLSKLKKTQPTPASEGTQESLADKQPSAEKT